jgi:hypothetical protein
MFSTDGTYAVTVEEYSAAALAGLDVRRWVVVCRWCANQLGPYLARPDADYMADHHRRRCPQRPGEES